MAAELISIVTDRPEGSFTVVLETKLRPDLADLIGRARRHRDAAREAQRRASAAQCEAVRSLAEAGLTTRDSGRLLGLTHQRVAQLLAEAETGAQASS